MVSYLKKIDLYAHHVETYIDAPVPKNPQAKQLSRRKTMVRESREDMGDEELVEPISSISTVVSGLVSSIVFMILIIYAYQRAVAMYERNETRFVNYDVDRKSEEVLELKDYRDSANFVLGVADKSIDLFNNAFFEIKAYELD